MNELSNANLILKKESVFELWHYACINWINLHKKKKGVCRKCGEIGKTYLHHLDSKLKPPKLFHNPENNTQLQILYAKRGKTAKEICQDFLIKYGEWIFQTIRYYSVSEHEVIELCAKCHSAIHKELEMEEKKS